MSDNYQLRKDVNLLLERTSKIEVNLFDMIYPKGSVYETTSSKNPSVLFGGAWNLKSITGNVYTWVRTDETE